MFDVRCQCSYLSRNIVLLLDTTRRFVKHHRCARAISTSKHAMDLNTMRLGHGTFPNATLKITSSLELGGLNFLRMAEPREAQTLSLLHFPSFSPSPVGISAFSNLANSTANQFSSKLRSSSGTNEKRTPARPVALAFTTFPVA